MKTETPPPTIAELWEEAEYIIECSLPHYEELSNPKNRVNEERRPIYVAGLAKCNARLQELRQQLLERCTTHDFNWLEPQSKPSVVPDQWIAYHKDNSAYHAFWAWELEQHKKEAPMHEYQFPTPCIHHWIVTCQYWKRCAHCGNIRPTLSSKNSSTW